VSWHPSIRESIGKLLSQNEQIDVAKSNITRRFLPE
jgi:adhesin transport system outer membrane protein